MRIRSTAPRSATNAINVAVVVTATAVLVSGCSSGRTAGTAKVEPLSPPLRTLVDGLVGGHSRPTGAILLLQRRTRVEAGAAGFARRDPPLRMQSTSRFRVASVTKTFVATLVLQLVADRKLRLDDSVESHLPGLIPTGRKITVRELLNHTSGMWDFTHNPRFERAFLEGRKISPLAEVRWAARHPLEFPPGSGFDYTNTNYLVLGLLAQRVDHASLSALLERRIFRPLDLRQTAFVYGAEIPGPHVQSYSLPSYRQLTTSGAWAAGSVVSSAPDLAKFFAALLGGKLLPHRLLNAMTTTVSAPRLVPSLETAGYGLGLIRYPVSCGYAWGHGGGDPATIVEVFSNRDGSRIAVGTQNGGSSQAFAALYGAVTQAYCDDR